MADPKSRKLRVFGSKIGAQLELLLNWVGPRVDSKETQGLFNKTAMAEGVSSNLGCRIWIRRSDLNGGVWTVRSERLERTVQPK
jgi:hypothetical protein